MRYPTRIVSWDNFLRDMGRVFQSSYQLNCFGGIPQPITQIDLRDLAQETIETPVRAKIPEGFTGRYLALISSCE